MMVSPLVVVLVLALLVELVTSSVNYTCLSSLTIPSSTQALAVANCLSAAGTSLGSATLKSCKKSTKTKDKSAKKPTKLLLKCLTAYHKAVEKLDKKKSPGLASAVKQCLATYGSYTSCKLATLAASAAAKKASKADAKWSGKKCSNVITTTACATSSASSSTTAASLFGSTTASSSGATPAPGAVGNCAGTSTGTGSLMTAAAMTGTLNYHNDMRAKILAGTYQANNTKLGPAASLPPMTWNCSLAASAQTWANGCVFQHDSNRGNVGENIYELGPATPDVLAAFSFPDQLGINASTSWDSEFKNNAITTLVMDASTVLNTFGHATQMAWSTSTQVGCGVATPCSVSGGQVMSLVVCRYAPPGNFVGQQPFQAKCSGAVASNNLTCA